MQNSISKQLGPRKVIELNPETGAVTLLDEERGFSLEPAEALRALRFLGMYEEMIGLSSFLATIADEGQEQLEVV